MGKNLYFDLYLKKGHVQAKNAILSENVTLSHRYGLNLLEIMPFLWISGLNWCQKYLHLEILGQKVTM